MSGKTTEERAKEAAGACWRAGTDERDGEARMTAIITRALRAEREQAVEEACKAVCVWCRQGEPMLREGWHGVRHKSRSACEHTCPAEPIRRALAPEKGPEER